MEIFILGLIVTGIVVWFSVRKSPAREGQPVGDNLPSASGNKATDDYARWISALRGDYPNMHEFEIFGTKAAVLWRDNDPEVQVVCLNRFLKGQPEQYSKYDYFGYNTAEKYWTTIAPKGAAEKAKDAIMAATPYKAIIQVS